MLKLHTLAEWMHGFLDPERPYGLPEDVYNRIFTTKVSAPSLSIKKSSCAGKAGIPQMNP